MSSDLCEFEECFFTDPFSPLSDSSTIDILKAFQENSYNLNPLSSTLTHENLDTPFDEIDQIAPTTTTTTLLSSSPPSHQLESLSLYQMGNAVNSLDLCPLEVKSEDGQLPFYDYYVNTNSFLSHSCGGSENAMKMMQRSYSSKSFDGRSNGFLSQPIMDGLIESSNLHSKSSNSKQTNEGLSSSALATEGSFMEEASFKVGRYSAEERKERILRYRAKRTHRNFNKKIKYACRKALADNRPRIRGRFARNDEPVEMPKASTFHRYEDEDELWMDGLQEEEDEGIPRGQLCNSYMPITQFHQFTYLPK
ncbi:putative zinc finger protein CONSTANS-LIKE 11 isoform X2 [Cynara cardunculus var. scolymus]|uniref:putative zinc finger protein CONSTANS-LIKE 11 isoform X2 n=1 Tax=Cynara cardunculus var. scolymus TaxID=59895 RepID=UPI000D62E525|nr:putative zinc finger protein CONSTANS-LIKE 11 isoform X2 [Cynara cardunculus var. scolymus]